MSVLAFDRVSGRDYDCYVCNVSDGSVFVAHKDKNNAYIHHIHKKCLSAWARAGNHLNNYSCPLCRKEFDRTSVVHFSEDLKRALEIAGYVGIGAAVVSWGQQKLMQYFVKGVLDHSLETPGLRSPVAVGAMAAVVCSVALLLVARIRFMRD